VGFEKLVEVFGADALIEADLFNLGEIFNLSY
jgi:hypothetical protein